MKMEVKRKRKLAKERPNDEIERMMMKMIMMILLLPLLNPFVWSSFW